MESVKKLRIETERLVIRPYKEGDLRECFPLMQDQSLFRYLNMDVMTFAEYSELFHWIIACYDTPPDADFKYSFNIILKKSGEHIGWCGLGGFEADHSQKEIFYLIGTEYQKNGYCKEAAGALLQYGFETFGLPEIIGLAKPENLASRSVLEGIGLEFRRFVSGVPEPFGFYNGEALYSLTKEAFQQKNEFLRKNKSRSCLNTPI